MPLTPIQEVRLYVGDSNIDMLILPDETYQYFLDKYSGNVNRAALDAAKCILFELTKAPTRERAGQVEVWNEWANAYRKALQLFLKDPNLSLSTFQPYAGGISKADMQANDANEDNVRPAFYQGFSSADGTPVYDRYPVDTLE